MSSPDIYARYQDVCERNRALIAEVERLKSGIRVAALTLVKWAIAAGGNTSMAIIAGNLRELIGEPDLKERP